MNDTPTPGPSTGHTPPTPPLTLLVAVQSRRWCYGGGNRPALTKSAYMGAYMTRQIDKGPTD
ncbi:MAG: hypothetical protein Q7T00_03105 [Rugosibacter sp.]|nr:hypothetical protein [Rugosibacter sp.]